MLPLSLRTNWLTTTALTHTKLIWQRSGECVCLSILIFLNHLPLHHHHHLPHNNHLLLLLQRLILFRDCRSSLRRSEEDFLCQQKQTHSSRRFVIKLLRNGNELTKRAIALLVYFSFRIVISSIDCHRHNRVFFEVFRGSSSLPNRGQSLRSHNLHRNRRCLIRGHSTDKGKTRSETFGEIVICYHLQYPMIGLDLSLGRLFALIKGSFPCSQFPFTRLYHEPHHWRDYLLLPHAHQWSGEGATYLHN